MPANDPRRSAAGHNTTDKLPSSWPIPGICAELTSAAEGLVQIHRATGIAPSDALCVAREEHIAALRELTEELIDRTQAPGEGVRDAA